MCVVMLGVYFWVWYLCVYAGLLDGAGLSVRKNERGDVWCAKRERKEQLC